MRYTNADPAADPRPTPALCHSTPSALAALTATGIHPPFRSPTPSDSLAPALLHPPPPPHNQMRHRRTADPRQCCCSPSASQGSDVPPSCVRSAQWRSRPSSISMLCTAVSMPHTHGRGAAASVPAPAPAYALSSSLLLPAANAYLVLASRAHWLGIPAAPSIRVATPISTASGHAATTGVLLTAVALLGAVVLPPAGPAGAAAAAEEGA